MSGEAENTELTPAQRLEAAEARVTELESAASGHEEQVSGLETARDEAVQRAEAAEARVTDLETANATLTEERDQARQDLEAAEQLATEAEQRAEAAEGRLAADPRFANTGGEETVPPAGGEGEAGSSDAEWHKRYMAASPVEKHKMYQERFPEA